jgi:hypothetical protein
VDLYDPRQNKPELFRARGQVTGQMHRLAKKYPIWQKSSLENSNFSTIYDWKFVKWIGNPRKGGSKATYLNNFLHNFLKGHAVENILTDFRFEQLPLFLKHHQILLFTVFTDEWKKPITWQAATLQN